MLIMPPTNQSNLSQAKELLQSIYGKPQKRSERKELAVKLAKLMLEETNRTQTRREQAQQAQLARMMKDPRGKAFTTSMTDQCFRSHDPKRVSDQMIYLLEQFGIPSYLSALKQFQLAAFQRFGQALATILVPLATEALRRETASVILPGEPEALSKHMKMRRKQGVRLNLNYLGEAILSEAEAERRLQVYIDALSRNDVEYVSVKISTLYSQIHLVGWDHTLFQLKEKLRKLYRVCQQHQFTLANGKQVQKFLNLDMEEYRDLYLTKTLFQELLDEPEFHSLSAGIVLQAYLPDAFSLQQELTAWAQKRVQSGGAPIKIRLVKGANLAMEQFEASLRGWPQAPYRNKIEVDANFKRLVEFGLQKSHASAVRIGVGSHNLFDIAYALVLRSENQVEDSVSFEMLEGMAEPLRRVVQELSGSMLLYCPAATREDFQSAVAYLIRRLDENTGPENFLRHTFGLAPATPAWEEQVRFFLQGCDLIDSTYAHPRRTQNQSTPMISFEPKEQFENEPDTDFSLAANRSWAQKIISDWQRRSYETIPLIIGGQALIEGLPQETGIDPSNPYQPLYSFAMANWEQVDQALAVAKAKESSFGKTSFVERSDLLHRIGQLLRARRADLCGVMMADAGKTLVEADPEVSEAIDFADYYSYSLREITSQPNLLFQPKGTVLITPPWNFPVSIPAGGILAALAAGNCVIFKPAPETVLCGWVLVNAFWDAGVPKEVLQFVNCPDDPVGSRLIADPRLDAIVLTGATSTALLFKKLNPFVDLFAETGGKNAMIVTALSDRDLAIKDMVQSAFGHAGQKCSAVSLGILEAEVYDDLHFLRQLRDAVVSLKVGSAWDPATKVSPLIRPPTEALMRGLLHLEDGESWLVKPTPDSKNPHLWSPGVKLGVKPGSFTHQTELFGPVLGLMRAKNLDQAIDFANGTPYGLTSGLQSLDDREQKRWIERIVAGNCYINRTTTGAIVQRQPFGGCKGSSFGTGAKAGGPNYLVQLMQVKEREAIKQQEMIAKNESMLSALKVEQVVTLEETRALVLEQTPGSILDESELPKGLEPLIQVAKLSLEEKLVLANSLKSYRDQASVFYLDQDPAKIIGQDNLFRYRPCHEIVYRVQAQDTPLHLLQVLAAALFVGCPLEVSFTPGEACIPLKEEWFASLSPLIFTPETLLDFEERIKKGSWRRARLVTPAREALVRAAAATGCALIVSQPLSRGRFELLYYLREISLSIDYHRYGNLGVREGEKRSRIL